jgi:phospholipid/cholesterol/gamma-HCH transport system substrate-binding protein
VRPVGAGDRLQALVFLLLGLALVLGASAILTGFPFRPTPRVYYVDLDESVAVIEAGAAVKYRGVKKGVVKSVTVDSSTDRVRIALEVDRDFKISRATKARISSGGLLGPYFIELYGGAQSSEETPDGGVIAADLSTQRRILEAGTSSLEHLSSLVINLEKWTSDENRARFERTLEAVADLSEGANAAVLELRPEASRTLRAWGDLGGNLNEAFAEARDDLRRAAADLAATSARARTFMESGALDRAALEAEKTLVAGREEIRSSGASLRDYLEKNPIAPTLERAASSLDRLEKAATTALATFESEAVATARADMGPALRSLCAA